MTKQDSKDGKMYPLFHSVLHYSNCAEHNEDI